MRISLEQDLTADFVFRAIHHGREVVVLSMRFKRDFKNVYQDVRLLKGFGLIDLKEIGPGRAATPQAKFAELILAA